MCFTILLQPLPKFFSLFLPLKKLLTEETFHQNFFHCLSDKIFETFDKLGNFLMQLVRKTFYILSIFVKFKDVGAAIVAQRWSKCLSIKSSLVRIPLYISIFSLLLSTKVPRRSAKLLIFIKNMLRGPDCDKTSLTCIELVVGGQVSKVLGMDPTEHLHSPNSIIWVDFKISQRLAA